MQFITYHHQPLQAALADYERRFGVQTPVVFVHPKAEIQAPEGIQVQCNAGCLVGEIWMPIPELTHQPALFEVQDA